MEASMEVGFNIRKKKNRNNKIKSQIEIQEELLADIVELSMAIEKLKKELDNDEPPPLPEQIR